jgi:hypothetical protein
MRSFQMRFVVAYAARIDPEQDIHWMVSPTCYLRNGDTCVGQA